eukprot:3674318-Rhodomonas_salina.3
MQGATALEFIVNLGTWVDTHFTTTWSESGAMFANVPVRTGSAWTSHCVRTHEGDEHTDRIAEGLDSAVPPECKARMLQVLVTYYREVSTLHGA